MKIMLRMAASPGPSSYGLRWPRQRALPPDLLLMCGLGWLATAMPLWPHDTPTCLGWALLSGAVLAFSAWIDGALTGRPAATLAMACCVLLLGVAATFDFQRTPPALLLAQCRSGVPLSFTADVLRHLETHWQWFPATNVAMLVWVCFGPHASAHWTGRVASSLSMLLCMGMAMRCYESLAGNAMSADGLVSAMLSGMAVFQVLTVLLRRVKKGIASAVLRLAQAYHTYQAGQ